MPAEVSNFGRVWALVGGYRGAAVVHALVVTGVADLLRDGPRTAAAVAAELDLDEVRVLQVLRAAAA